MMCESSRRSGVNVVSATGFFCESMGIPYHWRRQSVEEIAEFFVRDVTEGIVGTDVRCGVIKVSSGQDDAFPQPSPEGPNGRHIGFYEDRVFRAAARAPEGNRRTHHHPHRPFGLAGLQHRLEQLELLMEEGADPGKIIIGHTFYASIEQLEAILRHGAYVQLDNIGTKWRGLSDDRAVGLMKQAIDRGYDDRLLVTFDRFWYQMRGDRPFTELDPEVATRMPLEFLPDTFIPLMREHGIGDDDIHRIMADNPKRLLTIN